MATVSVREIPPGSYSLRVFHMVDVDAAITNYLSARAT